MDLDRTTAILARAASELADLEREGDAWEILTRSVHEVLGRGIVVASREDEHQLTARVVGLRGLPAAVTALLETVGLSPETIQVPVPAPHEDGALHSERFVEMEPDIHALSGGAIPLAVSRAIHRLMGSRRYLVVDLWWKRRLGSVTLILAAADPLPERDAVLALVRLASIALQVQQSNREKLAREAELRRDRARIRSLVACLTSLGSDEPQNVQRLVEEAGTLLLARGACYRHTAPGADGCMARWRLNPEDQPQLPGCRRCEEPDWVREEVRVQGQVVGTLVVWLDRRTRRLDDAEAGLLRTLAAALGREEERHAAVEARMRLETRIQAAQRMEGLGALAGGLAHDFNNLLTGIAGNAELAEKSLPQGHEARALLADARQATARAHDLVQQLLAYSGRASLQRETLDLGATVEQMVQLLAAALSKKTRIELSCEQAWVRADAGQLRQVLLNLLTNASEALPDHQGVVQVRTGTSTLGSEVAEEPWSPSVPTPGSYGWVEVIDQGQGMTPSTRDQLFDPFFTTKGVGRGLGLASVLGIVGSHGGAVRVRSSLGRGAVVRVVLPGVPAPLPRRVAPEPSTLEARVLLADDEDLVRRVGQRMLRRLGCQVQVARDGQEALEIFQAAPDRFDLVVMDLAMPRMDGAQAIEAMRTVRADLPAVLVSGWAPEELAPRVPEDVFLLQKPYSFDRLTQAMAAVLRR